MSRNTLNDEKEDLFYFLILFKNSKIFSLKSN